MKTRAFLLVCPLLAASVTSMGAADRGATQGSVVVSVGGTNIGGVRSLEGGAIEAEVVRESNGQKHLGALRYDPVKFDADLSQGKVLWDWVAAAMTGSAPKKNLALTACDFNQNSTGQRDLTNSLITEIAFPTLDASSKDAAWISLTVQPELIRSKTASGKCNTALGAKTKVPLASNFRLDLPGIDTSGVSKIEGLVVKQDVSASVVGQGREPTLHPSKLEVPNLKVTLSLARADSWTAWHDDFVVKGNNGADKEKSGAIVFLGPDLKEELARVTLGGVGIYSFGPNADGDRLQALLYVETVKLSSKAK